MGSASRMVGQATGSTATGSTSRDSWAGAHPLCATLLELLPRGPRGVPRRDGAAALQRERVRGAHAIVVWAKVRMDPFGVERRGVGAILVFAAGDAWRRGVLFWFVVWLLNALV